MGISIALIGNQQFAVQGVLPSTLERLRTLSPVANEWREIFVISVESDSGREALPMLGSYRVEDGLVWFWPQFPLLAGQRYRAVYGEVRASFEIPKQQRAKAEVMCVYPSANLLPENLLRFRIYFSAPMREGEARLRVRLLDASGNEIPGVFLETLEELWDASRTQLTLLLDPGRVKKGLHAHAALGRALVAGRSYRLVIDGAFRDAHGEPLRDGFEKTFRVTLEDVAPLELDTWRVTVPAAGTCDPLIISLPKPMDALLLTLFIRVRGADGQALQGEIHLEQDEKEWRFSRREPWLPGNYFIEVDSRLEDVAGNNLEGPFDRPHSFADPLLSGAGPRTLPLSIATLVR